MCHAMGFGEQEAEVLGIIPEPQTDEETRNIGSPGRDANLAKDRVLQSLLAGTERGGHCRP